MIIFDENYFDNNSFHGKNEQQFASLRVRDISRVNFRKQWKEEKHRTECTTVYYVQTGAAYGQIDGKIADVPENHFLLVKPGHETGFFISPAEKTFLYVLHADVRNVPSFEAVTAPFIVGKNAHIDDLFYHLFRASKMKMNLETTADALAGLILEQCIGAQNAGAAGEELYRHFCEYVESHLADDLSANTIQDALSYNKDYISRIVKKFSGKSMKEYVTVEKLYVAKHMLARKETPLREIAEAVGFSSVELFSKFFRYYTNTSPMEYRRGYRG